MDYNQSKRYDKIFTDRLYLLDISSSSDSNDNSYKFAISGSTANLYHVTIINESIKCDCPDGKSWAKHYHCVCKHCCFVLHKVLHLVTTTDHPFWNTYQFTDQNLEFIKDAINHSIIKSATPSNLLDRYKQIHNNNGPPVFENNHNKSFDKLDDDCPICFDKLSNSKTVGCPECKNLIHRDCMVKWCKIRMNCVYCRSDVWKLFITSPSYTYKNLIN